MQEHPDLPDGAFADGVREALDAAGVAFECTPPGPPRPPSERA